MTNEDKQLLLTDLCARLPHYKIICKIGEYSDYVLSGIDLSNKSQPLIIELYEEHFPASLEHVRPYLRPLSSMTAKETIEWYETTLGQRWVTFDNVERCVDWLLEHHFDFRGLIQMGLALEALPEMYKTQ